MKRGSSRKLRLIHTDGSTERRHTRDAAHFRFSCSEKAASCFSFAKSRLWLQIHADVLDQPIHLPRESEACALGSAMVAAVHSGHYVDLDEAAHQMVQIAGVIEPRPENKRRYDYHYAKYVATYPALRALMHEMAENGPL